MDNKKMEMYLKIAGVAVSAIGLAYSVVYLYEQYKEAKI